MCCCCCCLLLPRTQRRLAAAAAARPSGCSSGRLSIEGWMKDGWVDGWGGGCACARECVIEIDWPGWLHRLMDLEIDRSIESPSTQASVMWDGVSLVKGPREPARGSERFVDAGTASTRDQLSWVRSTDRRPGKTQLPPFIPPLTRQRTWSRGRPTETRGRGSIERRRGHAACGQTETREGHANATCPRRRCFELIDQCHAAPAPAIADFIHWLG